MYRSFIHVGYGKTATTWLQNKLFTQLSSDIYLGKTESSFPQWLLDINYLDDYKFVQNKTRIKEYVSTYSKKNSILVSSEAFTNFGQLYNQQQRILTCFENPSIICTIRQPVSWLLSNYKYCVMHEGFSRPLRHYLDFGQNRTPYALEKRPPFYIPDLFYNETIGMYRNLFGENNVLVLYYEDFCSNPLAFISQLNKFTGFDFSYVESEFKSPLLPSPDDKPLLQNYLSNIRTEISSLAGNQCSGLIDLESQLCLTVHSLYDAALLESLQGILSTKCSDFYSYA